MTRGHGGPVIPFLPLYRREFFSGIPVPPSRAERFRVLYAGRIERNKGVFDLLAVARRVGAAACQGVVFDLCGAGSTLQGLISEAENEGLEAIFRCHGHCDRASMRKMYECSHIVVVPTTTACTEGFNQVVVEGVLAGRPVVTSAVCPALSYVRDAVVEVSPDSVEEYCDAILRLRNDEEFYEGKRRACLAYQEQFYDVSRSWGAALRRIVRALEHGHEVDVVPSHVPIALCDNSVRSGDLRLS